MTCLLCGDTGKVIQSLKRTMGYTLAEGETEENTVDEHWVKCPACKEVKE